MQFCASFPVCHVCLMEEGGKARLPARLSLSHISQRHPSCRCGTVARSLARSLQALLFSAAVVRWGARRRKKKMRWITWMESGL